MYQKCREYQKSQMLEGVFFMGTKVTAMPGESVDSLIRKFNKKVQSEGILTEIKKREHYLKPSLRKQQKIQMARKKYIKSKF